MCVSNNTIFDWLPAAICAWGQQHLLSQKRSEDETPMWLVRIKSSYIQVEVYFVHKHQSSLTEGSTCVIFIFIHKYRHFSTQSIFHQSNRCSSRHRHKRIIAFMTGKLSCPDGWRFNLSLAAVSYKHVLPLVDCVWPLGFKIVPGKLIICTEQQWKARLIFLLHIRGWTRHRGPYQHNESEWRFNDDASLLQPM